MATKGQIRHNDDGDVMYDVKFGTGRVRCHDSLIVTFTGGNALGIQSGDELRYVRIEDFIIAFTPNGQSVGSYYLWTQNDKADWNKSGIEYCAVEYDPGGADNSFLQFSQLVWNGSNWSFTGDEYWTSAPETGGSYSWIKREGIYSGIRNVSVTALP